MLALRASISAAVSTRKTIFCTNKLNVNCQLNLTVGARETSGAMSENNQRIELKKKKRNKCDVYCPLSRRSTSVVYNRDAQFARETFIWCFLFFLHAEQRVDMTGRCGRYLRRGTVKKEYRVIEQSSKNKQWRAGAGRGRAGRSGP